MLIKKYLSNRSIDKLNIVSITNTHTKNLTSFAKKMESAFTKEINMYPIQSNISYVKSVLIDFDKNINGVHNSKFQSDIESMNSTASFCMNITNSKINIHILSTDIHADVNTIAVLMHAINTFCEMFSFSYDGLSIFISLDNNNRDLNHQCNQCNLTSIYQELKTKSAAFTVSGVTNRYYKKIVLTKKEEIVKLLFHEMIHYAGLDAVFVGKPKKYSWAIQNQNLNLSEAYTEFLSIVIYSCYISMHLADNNYLQMFQIIYENETQYSNILSAKIIDFFNTDPESFFNGVGEKIHSPICIFEYVILRTILMNNIDSVINILNDNFQLSDNTSKKISNLITIDETFINNLKKLSNKSKKLVNISYLLFDVDWSKV